MITMFTKENSASSSWESLLKFGKRQFVKRKTILYKHGQIGKGFYYIDKGLFKIVSPTTDGGDRILDVAGPHSLIGEQAGDQQPYFSTAVALEDSIVYYITFDDYRHLAKHHPDLMKLFAHSLIQKVHLLLNEINSKTLTSEHQVAYTLLKLSESCKKYEIQLTQQELADYTGLTRITIYKILKKWKEEHLIDIKNRRFLILQPEALKRLTTVS